MIYALLLIPSLLGLTAARAFAQTPSKSPLELLVLQDFNSVLSETYNESEGVAKATAATCKQVKTTVRESTVFCTVQITVRPDRKSRYSSQLTCTSMGYKVTEPTKSVSVFNGWDECIESINNVTEN